MKTPGEKWPNARSLPSAVAWICTQLFLSVRDGSGVLYGIVIRADTGSGVGLYLLSTDFFLSCPGDGTLQSKSLGKPTRS